MIVSLFMQLFKESCTKTGRAKPRVFIWMVELKAFNSLHILLIARSCCHVCFEQLISHGVKMSLLQSVWSIC